MSDLLQARSELLTSPIFRPDAIRTIGDLRKLMEHHVFAVWDFMCLVKALQRELAPVRRVWLPPRDREGARMINEIVLCEESDYGPDGQTPLSHFELYLESMREVGADTARIENFVYTVAQRGFDQALNEVNLPSAIDQFVKHTFGIIRSNKPWIICATFAHGRESIIPDMFQHFRKSQAMQSLDCPSFDYYLARHIEVDGGATNSPGHGELALRLLNRFCDDIPSRLAEAENAGVDALRMRGRFWRGIASQLEIKTAA